MINLAAEAATLPAWKSAVIGQVGTANIKLIKMDGRPIVEEVHDYDEAVFVIEGLLKLEFSGGGSLDLPTGGILLVDLRESNSLKTNI